MESPKQEVESPNPLNQTDSDTDIDSETANVINGETHDEPAFALQEIDDSKKKRFQCSWCDYSSTTKQCLTHHERRHTGEKPHECSWCDFRAITKTSVLRHERKHSGFKPYECSWCDYSAARKDDLAYHESTHTGEKPHKCSVCEYSAFTRRQVLRHEKRHSIYNINRRAPRARRSTEPLSPIISYATSETDSQEPGLNCHSPSTSDTELPDKKSSNVRITTREDTSTNVSNNKINSEQTPEEIVPDIRVKTE